MLSSCIVRENRGTGFVHARTHGVRGHKRSGTLAAAAAAAVLGGLPRLRCRALPSHALASGGLDDTVSMFEHCSSRRVELGVRTAAARTTAAESIDRLDQWRTWRLLPLFPAFGRAVGTQVGEDLNGRAPHRDGARLLGHRGNGNLGLQTHADRAAGSRKPLRRHHRNRNLRLRTHADRAAGSRKPLRRHHRNRNLRLRTHADRAAGSRKPLRRHHRNCNLRLQTHARGRTLPQEATRFDALFSLDRLGQVLGALLLVEFRPELASRLRRLDRLSAHVPGALALHRRQRMQFPSLCLRLLQDLIVVGGLVT